MLRACHHLTSAKVLLFFVCCAIMLPLPAQAGADSEARASNDAQPVAAIFDVVYTVENLPESFGPEEAASQLLRLASWQVRSRVANEWSPLTTDDLDEEIARRMEARIFVPFTEEIRVFTTAYNRALEIIKEEELDDPAAIREAFERARSGIDEFPGVHSEGLDTTFMDEEAWRDMVRGTISFQGDRTKLMPMHETEEEHLDLYRALMANLLSGPAYVDPIIDAYRLMECEKNREVAQDFLDANPELDRSLDEALRIMLQAREFKLLEFRMIEEHLIIHDDMIADAVAGLLAERREEASDLRKFATRPLNLMK